MINLLSSSWKRAGEDMESGGGVEMSGAAAGASLDRFFEDVESINDELRDLERIQRSLHDANEGGKSLHDASAVRALRSRMDADVSAAIKKATAVKRRLESLDRSLPGCGPGSSTDHRTRTSVVVGLRKKLRDSMESFSALRGRIASEYRDTVARRYFALTGAQPDEATLDNLAETGEGERFLRRAIAEQRGRGEVVAVVAEIQEQHDAVAQLERSLLELQQVFDDMALLVVAQGEELNDIEANLGRARSFVERAREQLEVARKHQKSSCKWMCIGIVGIILILVVVALIILPIVL